MNAATASAPASYNSLPDGNGSGTGVSIFNAAERAAGSGAVQEAVQLYLQFIASNSDDLKLKETAILRCGMMIKNDQGIAAEQRADAFVRLIRQLEPAWLVFPRAKTAKLIMALLELVPVAAGSTESFVSLLKQLIEWCVQDRRFFLEQSLQLKLAGVLWSTGDSPGALSLLSSLSRQLRKLDDKSTLVQLHLLEADILFGVKAFAKAKAALTAARTNANAVYCPGELMAKMDMQSGLLHAEDGDFGTAQSYFLESLDGYALACSKSGGGNAGSDSTGASADGVKALQYLLMCKIMTGQELGPALDSKSARPFLSAFGDSPVAEAFAAIKSAHSAKSLQSFDSALKQHSSALSAQCPVVYNHFYSLYDTLLEKNLLKLVAPYSQVPLKALADQLGLSPEIVEHKLCTMILDGKLSAVIDHDAGEYYLVQLEPSVEDPVYTSAITTVRNLDAVVDALYSQCK